MTLFYLPVVISVLAIALYFYFTRTFNYWKKRNVRGPEPTVFFGNLKESTLRRKNIGVVMQEIYDMFPDEKVVGIYRMTTPCLLVRDLDILKHIVIKDFEVFTDRGVEFNDLGQNLFHADGGTWRALRNRFTPIFTSGKLKNMFYLINEGADNFIDFISAECEKKQEFEIHSILQTYTMSTISACAFGVSYDSISDKLSTLAIVDKIISEPSYAIELDYMYPGLLPKLNLSIFPTSVNNFFKGLVKNIIAQRNGKPSGRNDFMDLILELRQMGEVTSSKYDNGVTPSSIEITDAVISAQAFVFYVAGYETSATTMAYLTYQLALNPDIQNKLIAEIDEAIKASDGKLTYDTVMNMKYLNKVFDETLRMHSIVEPLQRKAVRDYKVPGTDLVIEKDTMVLYSPRGIHYDPKYYTNPEQFNPDRFDAEEVGKRHPCAYLPFGLGQRNCIGMRFARLQSLLCITKILSKFRLEPSKNTNRNLQVEPYRFIIGPKGGIRLNIVPRKIVS